MRLPISRIVVLKGGPGSERQVSIRSGSSVAAALSGVDGLEVSELDVACPDFELPEGTELVYNMIHGTFGEDGALQEVLERIDVPYTGAGSASSRLAFDKIDSKKRFIDVGVPTPAYALWMLDSPPPNIPLPVVVKPPREGSSVGVHIVHDSDGLEKAREDVRKYGDTALVESFIQGKELTVGVLGDQALPIVHICPRTGFYDISNKYPWMSNAGGSDYYCPADLSLAVTEAVQSAAHAAHRSLGIEVYSRVDVLLSQDNKPYVLEVNTIPGMTESSLLPKAAAAVGINFAELCLRIAELSLKVVRS